MQKGNLEPFFCMYLLWSLFTSGTPAVRILKNNHGLSMYYSRQHNSSKQRARLCTDTDKSERIIDGTTFGPGKLLRVDKMTDAELNIVINLR